MRKSLRIKNRARALNRSAVAILGCMLAVCVARAAGQAAQKGSAGAAAQAATPVTSSFASSARDVNFADSASLAVCPVVYPDDQTPAARGYQYTFFGNAFFINDEGYLLTVAHVVETFGNGGESSILLSRRNAPPQLIKVTIVAKDVEHDVAILRATPNPFGGAYEVARLELSAAPPVRGEEVVALSLHPPRVQSAHSFELPREDSSPGTVLSFESTQLASSGPAADVFLLSHPVMKGQSGSPVIAMDSHAVVGLIEGLWLRGSAESIRKSAAKSGAQASAVPGAAIPIRYATALLDQQHISWLAASPPRQVVP